MSKRAERIVEVIEKNQRSNRGKWFWRCKAANGRIIFTSGETFNTKFHCKRQAVKEVVIGNKAGVKTSYKEIYHALQKRKAT